MELPADLPSTLAAVLAQPGHRVTRDGRVLAHHERVNRGAGERSLSREEIVRKFLANAEFALSRTRAEQMLEWLLHLERCEAVQVARALAA